MRCWIPICLSKSFALSYYLSLSLTLLLPFSLSLSISLSFSRSHSLSLSHSLSHYLALSLSPSLSHSLSHSLSLSLSLSLFLSLPLPIAIMTHLNVLVYVRAIQMKSNTCDQRFKWRIFDLSFRCATNMVFPGRVHVRRPPYGVGVTTGGSIST